MMFIYKIFAKTTLPLMLLVFLSFIGCSSNCHTYSRPEIVTAEDAQKLLKEGNERFVINRTLQKDISNTKKETLTSGQKPFAVILSCSDSRVPPEVIFDQGLGDIFIIRDAGNVTDPVILGSIEYGAEHLHAPLIVVLGHEQCGAVAATIDGHLTHTNIDSIIIKLSPAYKDAKKSTCDGTLQSKTEDINIKKQVEEIKKSPTIAHLIHENKVKVVGAKYSIKTGKVTFFKSILNDAI